MRTDELDYHLPQEQIAQDPAERRDASRLLVYRRATGEVEHRRFADLLDLLDPADLVVVNTTRVLPVRVRTHRDSGGAVELLLLEDEGDGAWEALARPSRRLRQGEQLTANGGSLAFAIEEARGGGRWRVRPLLDGEGLEAALSRTGEMPLPPYIHHRPADPGRYQTVYASEPGSAAAPTAGLHFTPELWAALRDRFEVAPVELRIGLDTFRPVGEDLLEDHHIHGERYRVIPQVRELLAAAARDGRRVVCVGTSAMRVVETVADAAVPDEGRTTLFITPGYEFRLAGGLVTNFHLPRSTLLALVMAFCGVEVTRGLYAEAVAHRYRFYSFGDASLLL
jgi:S-adenosylmethionine:tRNA ribosyltransferase-isomerase